MNPLATSFNKMSLRYLAATVFVGFSALSEATPLTFNSGDYYSSNFFESSITQYSPAGQVLSTMTVSGLNSGETLKGIAFGPDGLLYATVDPIFAGGGTKSRVIAIDASGTIQASYQYDAWLSGNLSYGKLVFDNAGHLFLGTGVGLARFDLGASASAALVWSGSDVFDATVLPSGNLVVASGNELLELTADGQFVRNIGLSDPNDIAQQSLSGCFHLNDFRGVEFDAATNQLFATMLGNSGCGSSLFFKTMQFDWTSGELTAIDSFTYGDDLFLASDDLIIEGSRTEAPRLIRVADLSTVTSFEGPAQMFVTQYTKVPEPGTTWLFAVSLFILLRVPGRTGRFLRSTTELAYLFKRRSTARGGIQ